jgi:hypothetical protein
MQKIITWMVIIAAVVFIIFNVIKTLKLFKRPDPCRGCGSTCASCPVYMKKK